MICEEREGDRACEMVSFTLEYFFYSSTTLLPFAISLITHGLLLLRSLQKKYYSISGCSLQHLYFVISPWVSCPWVFFTLPFSSVVSVLKDWCQVINFTSSGLLGKKKIPVQTDGLFYRQKHPSIFSAKPLKHFSTTWWCMPIDEMPELHNGKIRKGSKFFSPKKLLLVQVALNWWKDMSWSRNFIFGSCST